MEPGVGSLVPSILYNTTNKIHTQQAKFQQANFFQDTISCSWPVQWANCSWCQSEEILQTGVCFVIIIIGAGSSNKIIWSQWYIVHFVLREQRGDDKDQLYGSNTDHRCSWAPAAHGDTDLEQVTLAVGGSCLLLKDIHLYSNSAAVMVRNMELSLATETWTPINSRLFKTKQKKNKKTPTTFKQQTLRSV